MKGFRRPEQRVLPESASVPDSNVVPAPTEFTHELVRDEPYYFTKAQPGTLPNGTFPAGTRVVMIHHDGGPSCRVVDGRGLSVEVDWNSLKRL